MVLVIANYDAFLRSRQTKIERPKKKGLAKFGKGGLFILPPLNTNIILTGLLAKKVPKKKLARAEDLGVSFDLRTAFPGRIVPVGNRTNPLINQFQQYSCGCCWAYAIATSISDAFVVVNNYKNNPNLSWTYLLSCYPYEGGNFQSLPQGQYPSAQCGGGNVASVMQWIQNNGLATSVCVDYSWCINSPECTGQGGDPTKMNNQIPNCGCYEKGTFLKYKIKEVQNLCLACNSTTEPTKDEISNMRNMLKSHLKNVGPAIGCFHVFSNIVDKNPSSNITGDFKTSKNPEGIYLECVGVNTTLKSLLPVEDTNKCQVVEANPDKIGLLGAHAVAVMGWGEAPVSKELISKELASTVSVSPTDPNMVMVPYWWIRNSWGDTFAENGYFKMAMYPFNRTSQIERAVQVQTESGTQQAGGVVIFKPDTIINESFSQNDQKGRTGSGTLSDQENPNIGFFEGNQNGNSSGGNSNPSPANNSSPTGEGLPPDRFLPQNDTIPPIGSPETLAPSPTAPPIGPSPPTMQPEDEFKGIQTPPVINIQPNAEISKKSKLPIWAWVLIGVFSFVFLVGCMVGGYFLYQKFKGTSPPLPYDPFRRNTPLPILSKAPLPLTGAKPVISGVGNIYKRPLVNPYYNNMYSRPTLPPRQPTTWGLRRPTIPFGLQPKPALASYPVRPRPIYFSR